MYGSTSNKYDKYILLFLVLDASVPILMIRQPDWTKYDNFLSINGNKVRCRRRFLF